MGEGALEGARGSQDSLVGHLIAGRYRLTTRLATGSLGSIYLAQQRGTGITLALKIFRGEFAKDGQLVETLRRQMMAVATLSETHRHIVRVYDCDLAEDGSLYIAMELLEGRTLGAVMQREGPLEMGRALSLAAQLAEGLSATHAAGIVHTDMHPQNVLLLGDEESVKIIGFERARFEKVGALDHLVPSSGITRTPEYVAPEQIRRGEITHQTDIYALGVVLYEMLTGVVPFRASTPDAVLEMHLHAAPAPLKTLRPEIPVEVEAKVLQALEKEPKWRENDARDVVNDLLRPIATERSREMTGPARSVSAAPQAPEIWLSRLTPKSERASARWAIATISGLLILITAAAVWLLFPRRSPDVAFQPPLRAPLEHTPGVGSMPRGAAGETTIETSRPPSEAPSPPPVATKSAPPARPSPPTAAEPPDPSRIIDWILQQRGTQKR